jgi:glutathione S-transferase
MLKILGKPESINVRKVLWTCSELGIPCENEAWGSGHRPTDTPEFLALNPNAMVPVIIDDGFVLWESNTICRYLATRDGETPLLPARPASRAIVEQWMDWQSTELNPAWRYAFMALVRRNAAFQDASSIANSASRWNRLMTLLDRQLAASGGFVAGPEFTLADVAVGLSTHRWYMTPIERPPLPAVARYYDALSQRPGFMAHGRNGVA